MQTRTAGKLTAGLVLASVMSVAAHAEAATQSAKTAQPATMSAKTTAAYTAEDVLPLTCAQAWVQSGKSYPELFAIVTVLAKVSLGNRDLTFPNTKEAGMDAGKGIAEDCKTDPNGLLFAFVDRHVRRVAEAAARSGQ